MELCFLKGSELPDGHPGMVYKGRGVFLGDNVKDHDIKWAVFAEIGSAHPSMGAARAVDAMSCLPGDSQRQSDAIGAYC